MSEAQDLRSGDSPNVAGLLGSLTEDTTRLVRQEFALAKAETRDELHGARAGLIEVGSAMIMAQLALIILSLAVAEWLAQQMDRGWALLIVGGVWLLLALMAGASGRRKMRRTDLVPQRTVDSLRELPETLKGGAR